MIDQKAKDLREAFALMELEQREEYLDHLRRTVAPKGPALLPCGKRWNESCDEPCCLERHSGDSQQ